MGGHAGLHRYMKARKEEKDRLAEIAKLTEEPVITNFTCEKCGNRLKTHNKFYLRCPFCATLTRRPLP